LFIFIVAFAFLVKLIKQPIIIGYVLSGLVFSFMIAEGKSLNDQIPIFAELGIIFLLFLMGLEFDFKGLKYIGKKVLFATLMQTAIFMVISLGVSSLFGYSLKMSIYLAILFSFSSTLLVVKWLEDKKESSTLHGKIILTTLIIQDVLAILALTILTVAHETSATKILWVALGGAILVLSAFAFARYILNTVLKFAVRFPELLFVFSLGVCFLFVAVSPMLGYTTTIGAFIAGITLANTNYKSDIYGRLKPLIIFFNMLFFVGLGFQMKMGMSAKVVMLILSFVLLCLLLKPAIIALTLRLVGYDVKTSIISGLNMAQFSEFGIIIIAAGVGTGELTKEIGTISIIALILTMILSSYLIKYDQKIYSLLEKHFNLKSFSTEGKDDRIDIAQYNVIFFGYYEIGKELYEKFVNTGKNILVVEKDPAIIEMLKKDNIPYNYNSIANPYFFSHLDFKKTELVVSNLIDLEENKMLIKKVKNDNTKSVMIVTAKSLRHSLELYECGADYVIYPTFINEQQVSVLLEDYSTDINKVIAKKFNDISRLKEKEKKITPDGFFDVNHFFNRITQDRKK
jgi:Kef-type K+ transport system membrane component KefB